jgi:UDP-N-acetylmuramate: L-alanyl-gamma-D-glutamyl-meso-diaminopimelate ligase
MHIHILGICGTFMAGIARLARDLGHQVTGADQAAYPPMSDELAGLGIRVTQGYRAQDLPEAADLVVIGNALSRGNPAVEAVLARRMRYTSGPEWLAAAVLQERQVIALSGTHGKTTTTALVTHILRQAGLEPGWLVGGVAPDLPGSAALGSGECFVIEADEYDTAFFDKRSKFLHYRPHTLVINHLEFDHADIFPDLAAIKTQFHHLVRTVPANGHIFHRGGIAAIPDMLGRGCWTPVQTFDLQGEADFRAELLAADGSHFRIHAHGEAVSDIRWSLLGRHNVANALASYAVAHSLGIPAEVHAGACASFIGVRRRLELVGRHHGITVLDDFAHHPTAIRSTLEGLALRSEAGRVLAVLELRSNSMRLGEYRDSLADALDPASLVWVLRPAELAWDLEACLAPLGERVRIATSSAEIIASIAATAREGDAIVCMSNGDFEALPKRLSACLAGT